MPPGLVFCTNVRRAPSLSRLHMGESISEGKGGATVMERVLRMIGVRLEVGVKKFAASGPGASALRFDSHENRVDFRQNARVLEFQHPAVLFLIVHIEDAQILGWILIRPAAAPPLKRRIPPY